MANNHFQYFVKEIGIATIFFLFFIIICYSVRFLWYWFIAIDIQKVTPIDVRSETKLFKASFFIPLIYIIGLSSFVISLVNSMLEYNRNLEGDLIGDTLDKFVNNELKFDFIFKSIQLIFPLHLVSIVAGLYSYYFIAKTIKTAQLKKRVKFNDFIAEFFMLMFYPIGIWILQPIINKLYKTNNTKQILDGTEQY